MIAQNSWLRHDTDQKLIENSLIHRITIGAILLLIAFTPAFASDRYVSFLNNVEVGEIDDGDTPLIEIRLYGIDAPEKAQLCERGNGRCYKCGQRSKLVLAGLLTDEATYRFTGQSTYGRPVATIFLKQMDVNLEMVRQGHAIVYERYLDAELKAKYLSVQKEAKRYRRGIWQGKFIEPSQWRRGKRLPCEEN